MNSFVVFSYCRGKPENSQVKARGKYGRVNFYPCGYMGLKVVGEHRFTCSPGGGRFAPGDVGRFTAEGGFLPLRPRFTGCRPEAEPCPQDSAPAAGRCPAEDCLPSFSYSRHSFQLKTAPKRELFSVHAIIQLFLQPVLLQELPAVLHCEPPSVCGNGTCRYQQESACR